VTLLVITSLFILYIVHCILFYVLAKTVSKKVKLELWGSTFVKHKKTNYFPLLSKDKHRCILPPLGILLYNCHYVIVIMHLRFRSLLKP
jgi:hypothetical protein